MTHDEIRESLELYVLDSLDPREAAEVTAHVASCAECAAEVASLRDAVAALALAPGPLIPTPGLRAEILAAASGGDTQRGPSRKADSPRRPASAPPRRLATRLAALAAAAVIAVLLWTDLQLRRRSEDLERELLVTRSRAETAERELAAAQEKADVALAALVRERTTRAMFSDPKTTPVSMAGTPQAPAARARIAVDRDTQRAVLVCAGMPMPPAGKAYQLWFIDGEQKIPGGVFAPEADGTCMFPDRVPDAGRAAKVFAVTLEPASGVREPTGEIFLVGTAS